MTTSPSDQIDVSFCVPPDREEMVAELIVRGSKREGRQLAEMRRLSGKFVLEIYSQDVEGPWLIDLATLQAAVDKAKEGLLKRLHW